MVVGVTGSDWVMLPAGLLGSGAEIGAEAEGVEGALTGSVAEGFSIGVSGNGTRTGSEGRLDASDGMLTGAEGTPLDVLTGGEGVSTGALTPEEGTPTGSEGVPAGALVGSAGFETCGPST